MKTTVGDLMLERLAEEGADSVCSLDGVMAQVGRDLNLPLWRGMREHPLNYARLATARLARDDRFVCGVIRAHDSGGRSRSLRCFWIKGTEPDWLKERT